MPAGPGPDQPFDVETAYAVQRAVNAARVGPGGLPIGRKIGLTSPPVQQQLGVDRPDFGVLFEDMAYVDGAAVPFERLLQPRAEAEVGFVLERDIGPDELALPELRECVAHVVAVLEIVDSRIAASTAAMPVSCTATSTVVPDSQERIY